MPAKRKTKKTEEAVQEPLVAEEPIVLQLPIAPTRLDVLIDGQDFKTILEYNPNIVDPQPYMPVNNFCSSHDTVDGCDGNDAVCGKATATQEGCVTETGTSQNGECANACADGMVNVPTKCNNCYWCCHPIVHSEYGMPIRYDVLHKSFTMFGTFCSLECAAAYNYSVHMGSDRVWEIHSWIQMLARRYGFDGIVRPAPSRYLLQMFNGPLNIDEFRSFHKGLARTCVMNIPPFIHVVSQMEVLNTSFLEPKEAKAKSVKKKNTLFENITE